jgi:hypothetical protein
MPPQYHIHLQVTLHAHLGPILRRHTCVDYNVIILLSTHGRLGLSGLH